MRAPRARTRRTPARDGLHRGPQYRNPARSCSPMRCAGAGLSTCRGRRLLGDRPLELHLHPILAKTIALNGPIPASRRDIVRAENTESTAELFASSGQSTAERPADVEDIVHGAA